MKRVTWDNVRDRLRDDPGTALYVAELVDGTNALVGVEGKILAWIPAEALNGLAQGLWGFRPVPRRP